MPHVRPILLLLPLLALQAGCGEPPEAEPAPLDRFTFPTGIAVEPGGDLLVVSSNFDLTYNEPEGGTVLRVDPAGSPAQLRGGVRFPSYGGEIALADATACGLAKTQALVPSRSSTKLYVLDLEADGALSCGPGCELDLEPGGGIDPFGVTVACTPGRPPRAFVSYLRSEDRLARLSEIALGPAPTARTGILAGEVSGTRALAWDAEAHRLFLSGLEGGTALAWIDLAGGCVLGAAEGEIPCLVQKASLIGAVRGAALRGLALGSLRPGELRRLYATATLYDADLEASSGFRLEVGGALLVLELDQRAGGAMLPRFIRAVPMGFGASEVRVLPPAPGRGDVVAVAATAAGELWLWDDELETVAAVIGDSPTTGAPLLGRQPFAMATETVGGLVRIWVASFDQAFVSAVDVDPAAPSAATVVPLRIEEVRP